MSDITLQIYDGATQISDFAHEMANVSDLWYETGYPGGRYLAGGCYIPRVPTDWWEINKPLRVVIKSGQTVVYEGVIPDLQHLLSDADTGVRLNFVGYWAWLAQTRSMRKRWADDRVDDQTWQNITGASGYDLCTISREQRIRFVPKAEAWGLNEYAYVRYSMPPGETIKEITYDYELQEGAQAWELSWYDATNGSQSIATSSGTGSSQTYTLPTPVQTIELRYISRAAQTPTSDGTYFGTISNLMVFSEIEAGGIDLNSIAADIISGFSGVLNSDTNYLQATNDRTVEPFITNADGYEAFGDILFRAAEFGDTNDDRYAVGLLHSGKASTPDTKPVLFTEDWPDVAAYDYYLDLDADNVVSKAAITRDYGGIVNYVTVSYRDERGWQQIVTPDDDAGLSDATSIATYGQREIPGGLRIGNATAANAIDYGTRFVQKFKDPQWVVNGTIGVVWLIDGANGDLIPISKVEAGQRVWINGYDTHVIGSTRYDAEDDVMEIAIGRIQDPIFNETVFAPTWDDPVPESGGGGGGGGGGSGMKIWELIGLNKSEYLSYKQQGIWQKIKTAAQKSWKAGGGFKGWRDYYSGPLPF